jgi:hypothetical protein
MKASKIAKYVGADWMLYLDADEYLILNSFQGVKHMLKHYLLADSIAINWLMFGTNHHKIEPADGLLIENYTKSDLIINEHVKSFVRPWFVVNATNPHFFVMSKKSKMISIDMKNMRHGPGPILNKWNIEYHKCPVFIAHYVYQSEETYIKRKINFPPDDGNPPRQYDPNIHYKFNSVENNLVKDKYANTIKIFLESKMNLTSDSISEINNII